MNIVLDTVIKDELYGYVVSYGYMKYESDISFITESDALAAGQKWVRGFKSAKIIGKNKPLQKVMF